MNGHIGAHCKLAFWLGLFRVPKEHSSEKPRQESEECYTHCRPLFKQQPAFFLMLLYFIFLISNISHFCVWSNLFKSIKLRFLCATKIVGYNIQPTIVYVLEQHLSIILILGFKYIGLNNFIDSWVLYLCICYILNIKYNTVIWFNVW